MSVPGKNSYVVGVRNGNWNEDMRGMALGTALLHANPTMETTEYRTQYFNRGEADSMGPAPRGLDQLDGHLVMAHGTNIINRKMTPSHYLTLNQAHFNNIKEKSVLDGTVNSQAGARTELIRKKAMLRAANIDPWDPTVFKAGVPNLPMTVKPQNTPSIGLGPKPSANEHFTTTTNRALSTASSLSQTTNYRPDNDFSRMGDFTKSFKKFLPDNK